ncbi:MAG: hypothetical protein PHD67_01270 [Oscillospiraceae bacterium]|nr:hypothetical protein [Oscillospiraceae bacterium]
MPAQPAAAASIAAASSREIIFFKGNAPVSFHLFSAGYPAGIILQDTAAFVKPPTDSFHPDGRFIPGSLFHFKKAFCGAKIAPPWAILHVSMPQDGAESFLFSMAIAIIPKIGVGMKIANISLPFLIRIRFFG